MNEATLRKYSQALITHFLKRYTEKYGKPPADFNRYRDRWGFQSMIEDLGKNRSTEVVDYYLSAPYSNHSVSFLFYNSDKISKKMFQLEEDAKKRKQLMEETKRRVEAFDGKQGG